MLTILAAAALVLPSAGQEFNREVEGAVPREVLKTDVAGIWYQAFVDADGRITSCAVRGTLGESDAAELACEAIKGRRIVPATADGKPVHGVYRGVVVLADNVFRVDEIVFEPDVVLEVQDLPGAQALRTELVVMVDTQGRISACHAKDRATAYTRAACQQAQDVAMPIGKSASGEAVAYVYPLTYEFTENLASR